MNCFVIPRKQIYTWWTGKKKTKYQKACLYFLLQFIPYLANETLHNFLLIYANISNFWVKKLFLKDGKIFKKGTKILSETQIF